MVEAHRHRDLTVDGHDAPHDDASIAAALARGDAVPDDWDEDLTARLRRLPEIRAVLERMWPVLSGAELVHDLFGFAALVRSAAGGLLGADEQLFAAALSYHDRDLDEELTILDKTRSQMARILRRLPETALERVGVHNERGPRTLEQLVQSAIAHIPHHVKFIDEKRRALGV